MHYRYVLLDAKNQGPSEFDLGIEITDPSLLGDRPNLDPQHGPHGSPRTSAIEAALTYPLPPEGSRLATIRPDSDSIGAMAVFEARAAHREVSDELVAAIGRLDSRGPAAWRDPTVGKYEKWLRASRRACLGPWALPRKVAFMLALLEGKPLLGEVEALAEAEQKEFQHAEEMVRLVWLVPDVALVVEGNTPYAFEIGYRRAEVVVAVNSTYRRPWLADEGPHVKWTIARADENAPLDMNSLKARLAALEPGWGGTANLVASPQGRSPRLAREEILGQVLRSMHSRG